MEKKAVLVSPYRVVLGAHALPKNLSLRDCWVLLGDGEPLVFSASKEKVMEMKRLLDRSRRVVFP